MAKHICVYSGVKVAFNSPFLVLGRELHSQTTDMSLAKVWTMRVFSVVCSFSVPAMIINAKEVEQDRVQTLLKQGKELFYQGKGSKVLQDEIKAGALTP